MSIQHTDRILVTGGAGFLGSFVIEKLRARGYEDIVVPRRKEYDLTREADVERLYADANYNADMTRTIPVSGRFTRR